MNECATVEGPHKPPPPIPQYPPSRSTVFPPHGRVHTHGTHAGHVQLLGAHARSAPPAGCVGSCPTAASCRASLPVQSENGAAGAQWDSRAGRAKQCCRTRQRQRGAHSHATQHEAPTIAAASGATLRLTPIPPFSPATRTALGSVEAPPCPRPRPCRLADGELVAPAHDQRVNAR